MKIKPDDFRITPGSKVNLAKLPTAAEQNISKQDGHEALRPMIKRLRELQEVLYAQGKHKVLVVFQAMDAGGKDSTIRNVIGPLNPQGVRVTSFKAPTPEELSRDYLWRIHRETPGKGMMRVFNRSHYEDVLIVRVKELVPRKVWSKRYEQINQFERLLYDEGTTIVKFFLHISKDYQKQRLQRRLDRPDKHWKFNPDDLAERARWNDYQVAFEDAISQCSPRHAPWYVVPAEHRPFRNLLVAQTLIDTLESLDMKYPEPTFDPAKITID